MTMKEIKKLLEQGQANYQSHENDSHRFDKLMQRIETAEAAEKKQLASATPGRFKDWVGLVGQWFFGGAPQPLRYAALALVAIVIGQASYILSQPDSSKQYVAASGEPETTLITSSNDLYLVIFNATADIATISELLSNYQGQITNGPISGTAYTLQFGYELTKEQFKTFQNHELIRFFDKSD